MKPMQPIFPPLSCGNPVPTASWAEIFRAVPLRAMEPGQPYQRDEALLEELGYKTGQKAIRSDGCDGNSGNEIFLWFWKIWSMSWLPFPIRKGLKSITKADRVRAAGGERNLHEPLDSASATSHV